MQIKLSEPEIINNFNFDLRSFETFQSRVIVEDIEYTFARLITMGNYRHSEVTINGDAIGLAESPRAFNLFGKPACYAARQNEYDQLVPKLFFQEQENWTALEMLMPENIKAGKNWCPFTYNNNVYFVQEISPFRVLKLIEKQLEIVSVSPIKSNINVVDNYPTFRGGCNGLDIGNDIILGFGIELSIIDGITQHRPLAWYINMLNNSVQVVRLDFEFDAEYKIIKPTAFLHINEEYYLQTIESLTVWDDLSQSARNCLYKITITS